jgi:hypothetical protein
MDGSRERGIYCRWFCIELIEARRGCDIGPESWEVRYFPSINLKGTAKLDGMTGLLVLYYSLHFLEKKQLMVTLFTWNIEMTSKDTIT